jgi:flagellar FliJ protein
VLEYRRTREEGLERELRQRQHAHQQEADRLEGLLGERLEQQRQLEKSAQDTGLLGDELHRFRRYNQTLGQHIAAQQVAVAHTAEALAAKRQEMLVARQETRVIEKLEEKAKQRYALELSRREQQLLDELALTRSRHAHQ